MEKIEQMMVYAAVPFKIDGKHFFPMDVIDRVASESGPQKYAELVSELAGKDEKVKFAILNGKSQEQLR